MRLIDAWLRLWHRLPLGLAILLLAACSARHLPPAPMPPPPPAVEPPPPPNGPEAIPPAHGGETAAPTIDHPPRDGHGASPAGGEMPYRGGDAPARGATGGTALLPHIPSRAEPGRGPTAAMSRPDGGERRPCAATEEMLTAAECAAISVPAATGSGAFNSPDHMLRGESVPVRLVISRTAGSTAPAAQVEALPGTIVTIAPSVGRYMVAELTSIDGAFKVEPVPGSARQQDLFTSSGARWEWKVTALTSGRHVLTLTTQVVQKLPDGSFKPRSAPLPEDHAIVIDVTTGQRIADMIDAAIGWLGKTENLLKALAGAIAAGLALWRLLPKRGPR